MNRVTFLIIDEASREKVMEAVRRAPHKTRVEFKGFRRTIDQNERMWGLLADISKQVEWHGQKLDRNCWKLLFLEALDRETRLVPNLDGTGLIDLNRSSSDLSKAEMSDLQEIITAWGRGRTPPVIFHSIGETE